MTLHILKGKNLSEVFMRDTKLTVTLHIGGKQVETLTPEQRERIAQKFSESVSLYYSRHPEEFKKLKK